VLHVPAPPLRLDTRISQRAGLTQPLFFLLADNPASETPAVQDTPAENAVETQLTEDGAEQPEGVSAQRPITATLRDMAL
jgi:hypothetical protein